MVENKELNIKNIDNYFDIFDKGCMTLVEKGNKKNYLDAFNTFASFVNDESINTMGLDNRTINSLNNTMDKLYHLELLNEEVREALMLLVVKGLKHSDLPLDYITPDIIVYLYSHIISALYQDKALTILDTNVEMGFLMNGILNNLENEIEMIGITNDEKQSKVAQSVSNLCMNEVQIYYNDPLSPSLNISSNIAIINNYEKVYDAILKYYQLSEYTICLIDNDFFTKPESTTFRTKFNGTMLGLVVLPSNLFKMGKEKSILILSNKKLEKYDLSIIQIPDLSDQEKLSKVIGKLNLWLENISFKNIYNEEEL